MQRRAVPLLLDKPWFLRVSVPLWQISSSNESWGPIAGRAILPLPTFNFRLSTLSRKRSQRLKRGKGWKGKRGVIEVSGQRRGES